jgi:hypothetical protein
MGELDIRPNTGTKTEAHGGSFSEFTSLRPTRQNDSGWWIREKS